MGWGVVDIKHKEKCHPWAQGYFRLSTSPLWNSDQRMQAHMGSMEWDTLSLEYSASSLRMIGEGVEEPRILLEHNQKLGNGSAN